MTNSPITTKGIQAKLEDLTGKSEDSLTRLYLRMINGESWSYTLAKENLLLGVKTQEAYRKSLNNFSKKEFLIKGQKYHVGGKPRIPFYSNPEIIHAWVRRYSFSPHEETDAQHIIKNLQQKEEWANSIQEKMGRKDNLDFVTSLFSIYFMGKEVSNFFFKLLVISVVGLPSEKRSDQNSMIIFNLLLNMLSNLAIDRSYDGVDYLGKRFFLDIYVAKSMELLYSLGYKQRHKEIMRVAIIEDLVTLILDPKSYTARPTAAYKKYKELSSKQRIEEIFEYIGAQPDQYGKDFFGKNWKTNIAAYLHYALEHAVDEPTRNVKNILSYLQSTYELSENQLSTISDEFKKKINNPLRIWQMNTLI
ncbi:MAG: hypothetical protein ABH950_05940 [Candidatus Altiarchaeota archaeon]